jgi:hypothetical protein
MQSTETGTDCDVTFVYHLNFGIKPSGCFTTASNGDNWAPSSMIFYNNKLIRGDRRCFILEHDEIHLTDPKIPSPLNYGDLFHDLGDVYIPWHYKSAALDFGTIGTGQWVSKFHILGENKGDVNIQVNAISDNRDAANNKPLAPIQYYENIIWGDATVDWDSDTAWEYDGKLDARRRFPNSTLRSQLKQIEILPAYIGVYRYDDYPAGCYVTVDATAKTATLVNPTGYTDIRFPTDVKDMYISFSTDDYVNEYLITAPAVNAGTYNEITFTDTDDESVTASNVKWVIRGYRKEAALSIQSYSLEYAPLGRRGTTYNGASSRGENV